MRQLIEALRERPREDRQRVAFASSAALTATLLLGWGIATLGMTGHASTTSQTAAVAGASPGQELGQQVSDAYRQASASFSRFTGELRDIQQQSAAMQTAASQGEGAVVTIPSGN